MERNPSHSHTDTLTKASSVYKLN